MDTLSPNWAILGAWTLAHGVTCWPPSSVQVAPQPWLSVPVLGSVLAVLWDGSTHLLGACAPLGGAGAHHRHLPGQSCSALPHLAMWFPRARCHQAMVSPGAPLVCPLGASRVLTQASQGHVIWEESGWWLFTLFQLVPG